MRRHEVVTPLAEVLAPDLAAMLDGLVEARRWDIRRDPFEDEAHLARYLDATSGSLLWAAARSLGEADETVVRDLGFALGVANWLRAVPELESQGRIPLLDGTPDGVRGLARQGLERLNRARAARGAVSKAAAPAMLAGWNAGAILHKAEREPGRVAGGRLGGAGRLGLMARAATGRW